jgi:outer membrane protein assembly factor BamB
MIARSLTTKFASLVSALLFSGGLPAADWPMHRGSPELHGRSDEAAPAQPVLRWTFKAGSPVKGGVAIVGERVYFGDDGGIMHCVGLADGKEVWSFKTEGAIEATPLILDGLCHFGSSDGRFYALDAITGAKKWSHETGDKILGGANWAKDPKSDAKWIFIGSYDFSVYALDAVTGKVIWKLETENFINGTPSVTAKGETVFGGCDALLHVVSLKDGKEVRKIEAQAYIPGSVAADGRMVFFGNHSNQVFAFDITDGTTLWKYRERNFPYFSSPAINDDVVLIGGRDKRMHCIDRTKGTARWLFATRGEVDSSPVLCKDGGIIFGSGDGRLYCVNLADGKERWAYEIGSPIPGSPAVARGAIVVGAEDGNVYCLGRK